MVGGGAFSPRTFRVDLAANPPLVLSARGDCCCGAGGGASYL